MLTDDEKNATGCLFIVGLVLVCLAVGVAFEPWAGFALAGIAFMAFAYLGVRVNQKKGRQ